VRDELQVGREEYKQPTSEEGLKELDLCGMFAIHFEMSMLSEDIRKKIPPPLLQEIKKDHKNCPIALCVLRDYPIGSFVQHGTAKVEEFLFGQGNMLKLRKRFILEIHKLHLSNRTRDGIEALQPGQPHIR
jgi:hypothetical protein